MRLREHRLDRWVRWLAEFPKKTQATVSDFPRREAVPCLSQKRAKKVTGLPFHGRFLGHFMSVVLMVRHDIYFNLRLNNDLRGSVFYEPPFAAGISIARQSKGNRTHGPPYGDFQAKRGN